MSTQKRILKTSMNNNQQKKGLGSGKKGMESVSDGDTGAV